jgi:PAS domain S-box-containing protein
MQKSELEIYKRAMDEVAHILITDDKGNITYVNDKYCRLTKYSPEELVGQDNRIFKSGYHNREFYENMYLELNKGNIFKTVFKNKAKDGSILWLDTTIIPVFDKNNLPDQFITVLFDITDRIQRTELREEYISELSHEIRTPLHGLLSVVDLLSGTNLDQEQAGYLIHIKETSTQLGHLMNDLLVAIKIDTGKLQFEFRTLDIHQLAKSLTESFSSRETTKDIHYIHHIDQNIQHTLLGDPTRLRQILFNLLDNALKFTEKGIISLQAKAVEETPENQTIEFQVIDTGISITNERQKRIYEKLTVSDKTGIGLYGESGMSLRVVKNLIELQHGSFSFEMTEGTGSVFTFRIPYKKAAKNNESTDMVTASPEQQVSKYNILIAEDDKINQLIYKKQMLRFNYTCKIAEDGFEALDLLQRESFDLLLLDMQMPGMNGDEVLQKIRNELSEPVKNIPVICISATVYPKVVNALMEAGADAFLTKPYKESELAEIITKTLSNVRPTKKDNRSNETAFINLEPLNQFANGDNDFIIEILEYFKSTTPGTLESMQQNFTTNNVQLCGQLHKYRSQVALLGLTELTELTLTLETALNETNDYQLFQHNFETLLAQSHAVILEAERLITKLKTGRTL